MYIDEISLIKVPDVPETTTTSTSTSTTEAIPVETFEPITDLSFSPDWVTKEESSSTSKTSTVNPTTSIATKPVFYCNFDQSNVISSQCGGSVFQLVSGSTPAYGVLNTDVIYFGTLLSHVTDIKSISKLWSFFNLNFKNGSLSFNVAGLTAHNYTCNIPYNYLGNETHFCALTTSNIYKCEVGEKGSGVLDDCVKGLKENISICCFQILLFIIYFVKETFTNQRQEYLAGLS